MGKLKDKLQQEDEKDKEKLAELGDASYTDDEDEMDYNVRRNLRKKKRKHLLDESGVSAPYVPATATHQAAAYSARSPHVQYVPVTMPLNSAYQYGQYPRYYQPYAG